MAEIDPLDKLEEQLKCNVCLDTYTDPKVLLCNHAYCKGCIDLLVRNSRSITCPNCRKVTPIPENGVKDLQPAFRINNLLEIQDSLKKKVGTTGVTLSYCHDHCDEELKVFCETCSKLICLKCVIRGAKHHNCDYEMLNKVSGVYKAEVVASLEPVKKNLARMESTIEQLEIFRGDISDQCAVAKASIRNAIRQLHEDLEFREKTLINQLQTVTDKKLRVVAAQADEIKTIHAHLEQCHAHVEETLDKISEEELVKTKTEILKQIVEASASFKPDILKYKTQADMKFTAPADTIGVCQTYGLLSAGEMFPDPTQCYATGPGLEAALVGEETTVCVQVVNFVGDSCKPPVQSLRFELVSEINGSISLISDICLNRNQHEAKYTPAVKGQHQLCIMVDDQHIKGSPFAVRVESRGFFNQISAIKVDRPWGITVSHKIGIIVTEHRNHRVSVFRPNGEKLRSFGILGSKEGQFNHPRGVAVDDEDNILVTDYKNNRIQKFTTDGKFLSAVGTKGSGALQFKGPKGIAFNMLNRKVYVVDENERVQILNQDFSFFKVFGEYGKEHGQLTEPWGIECDKFGRVYIPLQLQNRIQVFTADGAFLHVIGKFGFANFPFDIAIDSTCRLFLSLHYKDYISTFTMEGESLGSFGSTGKGHGQLNQPRGIAIGDCDVLYVCDYSNNRISIY